MSRNWHTIDESVVAHCKIVVWKHVLIKANDARSRLSVEVASLANKQKRCEFYLLNESAPANTP